MSSSRDETTSRVYLKPGTVGCWGVPECVGDSAVIAFVLVRSRDLDDGSAGVGHLHDVGLVDVVIEFRGVVVNIGHLKTIKRI